MRGVKMPKDTKRAYTIASDALLKLADYADDFSDVEARYRVRGIVYTALAEILDMVDDDDPTVCT